MHQFGFHILKFHRLSRTFFLVKVEFVLICVTICLSDVTMNRCKYQKKLEYLPHVCPYFFVYVLELIEVTYLIAIISDRVLISNYREETS